ncbi:hypothetical protein CAPTEDRAFT_106546, partial [Capitella teleta]
ESDLQLKPSKCHFGLSQINLLRHFVSAVGIKPLSNRVEAIKTLGLLRLHLTSVWSFLGMAGYYRQFIPGFA